MEQIKIFVETIAVIMTGLLFLRVTNRSMQILQQEHYLLKGYISYTKKYYFKDKNNLYLFAHLLFIPFLNYFVVQVVFIVTASLLYYYQKPLIVKKLKFTLRIRRLYFTHLTLIVITYTLVMMKVSFIHLTQVTLISLILAPVHLLLAYVVNWPAEYLISLMYIYKAKRKLNKMSAQVIAITGSYGKTTTKNIIYELLKNKFMTTMSPASYNTPMGLCRTINYFARKNDEVLVLEMGATHKGDIKELVNFIKPNYAIITEIGPQHLETFKNIDNIINEKFNIVNGLDGGIAILNYDNEYIRNYPLNEKIKIISIAIDNPADFYAENIKYSHQGLSFNIIGPKTNINIETSLLGRHNIYNILLSIALIKSVDYFSQVVNDEEIIYILKNIKPVPHRLSTYNFGELSIIDDAFNSNFKGFVNALEILKMSKSPRILITPGIVEMGNLEFDANKSLATFIAQSCEVVYLVDNPSARAIKEGLLELGFDQFVVVKSFKEAYNDSVENNKEGTILIENDLTDNLIYRG